MKVEQDDPRVLLDLRDVVRAEEVEEEVTLREIAGDDATALKSQWASG